MKKILFLSPQPYFAWRGSPIRVHYNLEALAELGYAVDFLTFPFGTDRDIPGVRLLRLKPIPFIRTLPIGPSLAKLLFDVKMYFRARRMIAVGDYDAVHGVEDAGFLAVLLCRRKKIPCIYEKHSDPKSHRKGFLRNMVLSVYARVETFTIRRADAVITTGEGLKTSVKRINPEAKCVHIFDIPSSRAKADPDQAAEIRNRFTRGSEDPVLITYVGSFAVYQGIDLLFESIPAVCANVGAAQFLIVGGSEDEIRERRAQMVSAGCGDRVHFLGKIDPDVLPDYLSASDILLSPRISGHNTPLKILDYFKAGAAILATDVEANRLILDEQTAHFAAPEPRAFAEELSALAEDEALRDQLARKGMKRVAETYNFDVYRQQLGEVVADVIQPETRPADL